MIVSDLHLVPPVVLDLMDFISHFEELGILSAVYFVNFVSKVKWGKTNINCGCIIRWHYQVHQCLISLICGCGHLNLTIQDHFRKCNSPSKYVKLILSWFILSTYIIYVLVSVFSNIIIIYFVDKASVIYLLGIYKKNQNIKSSSNACILSYLRLFGFYSCKKC